MGINWKPHTVRPVVMPSDGPAVSILVVSPARHEEDLPCIAGVYEVRRSNGEIYNADSGGPPPREPYFWVREDEIVEGVPCVC